MGFLAGVLLATLAGWSLTGRLGLARNGVERLGASIWLGLGLVTFSMFLVGALGAPIRPLVYLPPVALLAFEGVRQILLARRGSSDVPRTGAFCWRRWRPRARPLLVPVLVLIALLVAVVVARGWLLPNRFYDSLTSFDLLGRTIAMEEVFRVSLFEYTPIARGGSYPPFTALYFAFSYDMGVSEMTRAVLLPFGALLFWILGVARRNAGAASAFVLLAACLLSPDFNSYLQLPLTQLPVAAFGGATLLYLHTALVPAGGSVRPGVPASARVSAGGSAPSAAVPALIASAVFALLAAWTRADAIVFTAGAWLALLLFGRGRVPIWLRVTYGLPAIALTLGWQMYAASALGDSGAGRFVDHPFWDWPRLRFLLAVSTQLLVAAPLAHGLAGGAVLLALISHALARRSIGPLAIATLAALAIYTFMFYQVDPVRQDPLTSLMRSSYRRGVTAFVWPMWTIALLSPLGLWGRRALGRLLGR